MRALNPFRYSLLALGLAMSLACSADGPNSPTAPPANPVPAPTPVEVNFTFAASRGELVVNGTNPSILTIRAVRADNGQPFSGVVTVTTTLGGLGSVGGPQSVDVVLVGGVGTIPFFPGGVIGTASISATLPGHGTRFVNINIREEIIETFFISSVNPNTGSPQGGESVTIFGGGFDGPIRVTFNGVAATVQSFNTSEIHVITPPLLGGLNPGETQAVNVVVTINLNQEGQASDTLPSGFIYANGGGSTLQPTIFSITPASGPNEGGTQVTINGDGFEAPVQVKFGSGTSDTNFNGAEAQIISVTRTRIVVLSPATSCGGCAPPTPNQLVNILVKNQNTSRFTVATSAFRYGNQILVTSIAPGEGPSTGGTTVTIFGQGFDEPVAVSMGQHAQQVLSVSGSEIVVMTVPILITNCADVSGPTNVTNIENGQSATGPVFTYRAPRLFLTGISPNSGPQSGGTAVTIFGSGFSAPLTVSFGATTGSVGAITPTTVAATTPPFPDSIFTSLGDCDDDADLIIGQRIGPVSVDVRLTNPVSGCTSTLTGAFRVSPSTTCRGD